MFNSALNGAENHLVKSGLDLLVTVRYFTTILLLSHLDKVIRAFISSHFDSCSSLYFSITQTFFKIFFIMSPTRSKC